MGIILQYMVSASASCFLWLAGAHQWDCMLHLDIKGEFVSVWFAC